MDEYEKLDLKFALVVFDLMKNEKIPFENKKFKMESFINMLKDKSVTVYGKSLASWAKFFGDEKLVDFMKEKEVEEKEISKEEAEKLGKQFWDKRGEVKKVDEIKELVLMGAD